jgi:L-iditol 2-dehydrogenase
LQAAVRACSVGGRVVLVGMGDEVMKLDMTHACTHEIDLVGSFRYANTVRAPLPIARLVVSCAVL